MSRFEARAMFLFTQLKVFLKNSRILCRKNLDFVLVEIFDGT